MVTPTSRWTPCKPRDSHRTSRPQEARTPPRTSGEVNCPSPLLRKSNSILATDTPVCLLWPSSHQSVYVEQLELCFPTAQAQHLICQQGQYVFELYPDHHPIGEVCCMIVGTPTNDPPKFNPGFMNALPDMSAAPIASKDAAAANDGKVL